MRGLQGDDLRDGVIATGKHFLAYGLSEGGMNHAPVQLGPRELREVFAEPFAAAIRDAGLASVMNSYSSVDGLPCAGSHAILTGLLRDELGFDGVVVADYFSVALLMIHHRIAATAGTAAALALTAGLDMELPAIDCYGATSKPRRLGPAPHRGHRPAVRRALAPSSGSVCSSSPTSTRAPRPRFPDAGPTALARRAAAASVVLLTNDGVLPLPSDIGTVAVIGPGADERAAPAGRLPLPRARRDHVSRTPASALASARRRGSFAGRARTSPRTSRRSPPCGATFGDRVVHAPAAT